MSALINKVFVYAKRPDADGTQNLRAKIFCNAEAEEPQKLIFWAQPVPNSFADFDPGAVDRIATQAMRHGYALALFETRDHARVEDLSEPAQNLLPDLIEDARDHDYGLPEPFTGPAAIAAVEDCASFIRVIAPNHTKLGASDHFLLAGSGLGGATVLHTLFLAEKLGLPLPPIQTAIVLSGAFAFPSFYAPTDTRILALHGLRDPAVPPKSIRQFAYRAKDRCALQESDEMLHGSARLTRTEPMRYAVRRFVRFDRGSTLEPLSHRNGEDLKFAHKNPICVVTCVKNEGPFLLEWIAYNRSIGVTDFIIFSNDCDDGTAEMLDRLEELGIVHHFDNPSGMIGTRQHLGVTVSLAPLHKAFRKATYAIVTDVDEFIQIDSADGTLNGLLAEHGYPDAISLSELLYGFGGVEEFQDKLVTEQFQVSQELDPVDHRARRGVKTIMRVQTGVQSYGNHRPTLKHPFLDKAYWTDGAGNEVSPEFITNGDRGLDVRGRYSPARVNHYTLRSGESMLVKFERGDAVRPGRMRKVYFKHRNGRHRRDDSFLSRIPAIRAELDALLADATLKKLHRKACTAHRAKIKALKADPEMAEIWAMIQAEVAKPIFEDLDDDKPGDPLAAE